MDKFRNKLKVKSQRILEARKQEDKTVLKAFKAAGMIGWSVAVPTILGIALGLWLDHHYKRSYSWTLIFLIVGIIVGCILAWKLSIREITNKDDKK